MSGAALNRSTATPLTWSAPVPPSWKANPRAPDGSSLTTNPSLGPDGVRVVVPDPGSKSAAAPTTPTTYTLPESSAATARATLSPDATAVSPIALAQTKLPLASSFETKMALEPVRLNVPGPGSKSAVPVNVPTVMTLPDPSAAIPTPS